VIKNNIVS